MSISYLISLEQLSVLAHFCKIDAFKGLPEMPVIDRERCNALVETMAEQGMVHLNAGEIAVDVVVKFILSTMAASSLFIQAPNSICGYCTDVMGVVVLPAARSVSKYKIVPMLNANVFAAMLWESCRADTQASFVVETAKTKIETQLTKAALEKTIARTYTEDA